MKVEDALSKFGCERNIERYVKLLKGHLTDMERDFVERRLREQKQALSVATNFSERVNDCD
jgi:hypothetical protein